MGGKKKDVDFLVEGNRRSNFTQLRNTIDIKQEGNIKINFIKFDPPPMQKLIILFFSIWDGSRYNKLNVTSFNN